MNLYHGTKNKLPKDLRELKFDRHRSETTNQEGPGWYWTDNLQTAEGYAGSVLFIK